MSARQVWDAWKVAGPCARCGRDAEALAIAHGTDLRGAAAMIQADHLPHAVKVDNPSRIARHGSTAALVAELAKCQRLCANCHSATTSERSRRR